MLSDTVTFDIQKNGINLAQFGYNSTTLTSSFCMNNVDILALIASTTIDLTNLRTTPTANITFNNSYGNPTAYLDDNGTLTTLGILSNSGGVSFTNGLTVSGASSISYDPSHKLELTATGTNITGDCNITGALSSNSFPFWLVI